MIYPYLQLVFDPIVQSISSDVGITVQEYCNSASFTLNPTTNQRASFKGLNLITNTTVYTVAPLCVDPLCKSIYYVLNKR